jgi:hypothetical protein
MIGAEFLPQTSILPLVRWSYVSPVGVNPGADGILRALENLVQEGAS